MLDVGDLDLVATFSELSLACSDCRVSQWFFFSNLVTRGEIEQNLPLAWTSLSVACPTICMQRRDKRGSNVSWSASERRVTKRTVAYRPAVSIRLSRSLGFPTCLFLASPLSGPHERRPMASRKEQLSSLFFVAWTTQPLHEKLFMGFRRANFTQRSTNRQKNIFVDDRFRGHHPRALIQKLLEIERRDCVWGCARRINTTWENLKIERHKSVHWAERTPSWFVLFDLQIFSGRVYPPSAASRTISFFYFQLFLVLIWHSTDN